LEGGPKLTACLDSLARQTFREFQVVVVDNSCGRAPIPEIAAAPGCHYLRAESNLGYGAAINLGARLAPGEFVFALNDDTELDPGCLAALVQAMEEDLGCAMVAPAILLPGKARLDSAGMLIARDGSSKQRGHNSPPEKFAAPGQALLPSGCAALYRRAALDDAGWFDESFFLYCEETDLGLRLHWKGWTGLYAPAARVLHHYSATAGRASSQKAWLVERNRLRLITKNFPSSWLAAAFLFSLVRYAWHVEALLRGRGTTGAYRSGGGSGLLLPWLVLRAHAHWLRHLPGLLQQRRAIFSSRRLPASEFRARLKRHRISLRQVASL
jgi:GT2 family glycosyltransferase